jgi:hypothetical protein
MQSLMILLLLPNFQSFGASFVLPVNIVKLTVPSKTLIIVRIVNVLAVCLFLHKCTTGEIVWTENT